jgi:hypothetical protein
MIAALLSLVASGGLLAKSNGGILLLAGPAGGGVLYVSLWRYYRNTDKSHSFERETRIASQPVTGNDRKVDEVKGTKKSKVDGDNHNDHRQRVQRV